MSDIIKDRELQNKLPCIGVCVDDPWRLGRFSARVAYAPTIRSSARPLFAVAVKAADEVASILVAERDCYVLGGHFKLVYHVPAREVGGWRDRDFPPTLRRP